MRYTWNNSDNFTVLLEDILKLNRNFESQLEPYYPIVALISLMLSIISIFLATTATLWERFGMDPMKRGVINRLVSCMMELVIFGSTIDIIEELYVATNGNALKPTSSFIYGLRCVTVPTGILLSLNEIIFIKYMRKIVFKRMLAFNDDLIGIWLEVSNFVVALGLACVQSYDSRFAKLNKDPSTSTWPYYPTIKIPLILALIMVLQTLVAIIHSVINYIKRKKILPQISIHIISNNHSIPINNLAYNPDLANLKKLCLFSALMIACITLKNGVALTSKATGVILGLSPDETMTLITFTRRFWFSFPHLCFCLALFWGNSQLKKFAWKVLLFRFHEL